MAEQTFKKRIELLELKSETLKLYLDLCSHINITPDKMISNLINGSRSTNPLEETKRLIKEKQSSYDKMKEELRA